MVNPSMSDVAQFDTATRGHHPDSASSLQTSEACPCFENEQRDSAASKKGILQHKAVETRDLSILDGDEDMEEAVRKCIDYEDSFMGAFKLGHIPFTTEQEVYLSVGDEVAGTWKGISGGSPDRIIVAGKQAIIFDWKFGKEPVTSTKNNLQGIVYVLGAFEKYPEIDTVQAIFFSPHQGWSYDEQQNKYVHTFYRKDVPELELRVRTVIARKKEALKLVAKDDWSMAQPKTDLCIWCKHKGLCKKVAQVAIRTSEKYTGLEVPEVIKQYDLTTPEQVAAAYKFVNQLAPVLEAIKKRCTEASLTEDLKPEGFNIIKVTPRDLKDKQKLIDVAFEFGVTNEEMIEIMDLPLTKLEEKVKSKAVKGKGAATVRKYDARLLETGAMEEGRPYFYLKEIKSPADKRIEITE